MKKLKSLNEKLKNLESLKKFETLTLLSFFGILIFATGMFYSSVGSTAFISKAVLTVVFIILFAVCWTKRRNHSEEE